MFHCCFKHFCGGAARRMCLLALLVMLGLCMCLLALLARYACMLRVLARWRVVENEMREEEHG